MGQKKGTRKEGQVSRFSQTPAAKALWDDSPCSAPLSSLAQHWIRGMCYTSGKKGWSWQNISWAITGAISSLFVHPVQLQEHQHCSNTLSTPENPENSISLPTESVPGIANSGVLGALGTVQRFLCATKSCKNMTPTLCHLPAYSTIP